MNKYFYKIFLDYQEISVRYDVHHKAIWCYFNPAPRPCFSLKMLQEIKQLQQSIITYFKNRSSATEPPIRYQIYCSQVPGVFNLGGDLALFSKLIKDKNHQLLSEYAKQCIELCYFNAVNLNLPLTTIALVEGMALGGGFEMALSSNILVATEDAEMGFPEIRFNLFPGMGAYSFLARRCGMATTDRMLTSGAIFNATELSDLGIVHHLVKNDNSQEGVKKFIRQHQRLGNGHRALQQVRQCFHPVNYQELSDIVDIWVEAAIRLENKDLRMMDRLVKAQEAKMARREKRSLLRTKQDRRFAAENVTFPLTDWSGETVISNRRKNLDRRGDSDRRTDKHRREKSERRMVSERRLLNSL